MVNARVYKLGHLQRSMQLQGTTGGPQRSRSWVIRSGAIQVVNVRDNEGATNPRAIILTLD
ncbi:hypothetical protein PanWU01x14_262480 [Parasponia andersonii]|uniref:Uncharacterized protein n=1 Tax=Parasponia andersonii TaxID=3476 RepID=A0A2P5B834_PARAD|nr:hypothetical protein PanWU01x14_262480 [Parasponia andersonii]